MNDELCDETPIETTLDEEHSKNEDDRSSEISDRSANFNHATLSGQRRLNENIHSVFENNTDDYESSDAEKVSIQINDHSDQETNAQQDSEQITNIDFGVSSVEQDRTNDHGVYPVSSSSEPKLSENSISITSEQSDLLPLINSSNEKNDGLPFSISTDICPERIPPSSVEFVYDSNEKKDKFKSSTTIYISRHEIDGEICHRIAERLEKLNYRVIHDVEKCPGNFYTAVSEGIEEASIILVAFREKYAQNSFNKMEYQYAQKQHKLIIPLRMEADFQPHNSLDMIIGSLRFVDFSSSSFDVGFEDLQEYIGAILGFDSETAQQSAEPSSESQTNGLSTSFRPDKVSQWTEEDVVNWLHEKRLDAFRETLRFFQGKTLCRLRRLQSEAKDEYYKMLQSITENDPEISLYHQLLFDEQLELLPSED